MLDREPFLKAIFAAPADDLPRLVFADWLDEQGDPTWAELIRVGCRLNEPATGDLDRHRLMATQIVLLWERKDANDGQTLGAGSDRGFAVPTVIEADADLLADTEEFRRVAVRDHPEWYGATRLKVAGGVVVSPAPLVTILSGPVTERVTDLDVCGREVEVESAAPDPGAGYGFRMVDFTRHPTIHPRMVDELAGMRECRRLTALDLRNNELDNMALHALAESVYFTRLKRLRLSDGGNRFRGRVWQKVLARFGEDVVE